MDFLKNPTEIGWIVIAFVSLLIFIIVMTRGFKFDVKNRSLSVGKQIDSKLALFKKEESQMRKLFKATIKIDEHLSADERQSVRMLDAKIAEIFAPYFTADLPLSLVTLKIRDELNKRLDYNNTKEKLAIDQRSNYLTDIMSNLRDKYSTFYLQATTLNAEERYPRWEEIEEPLRDLISEWQSEVAELICKSCEEKIKLYDSKKDEFETKEYKENSIDYPIRKNKGYITALRGA